MRIRRTPAVNLSEARAQAKRLDWEMLKLWAELGEVCLKYLDESGCCCESDTDYGYGKRAQQLWH